MRPLKALGCRSLLELQGILGERAGAFTRYHLPRRSEPSGVVALFCLNLLGMALRGDRSGGLTHSAGSRVGRGFRGAGGNADLCESPCRITVFSAEIVVPRG